MEPSHFCCHFKQKLSALLRFPQSLHPLTVARGSFLTEHLEEFRLLFNVCLFSKFFQIMLYIIRLGKLGKDGEGFFYGWQRRYFHLLCQFIGQPGFRTALHATADFLVSKAVYEANDGA